MAGQMAKLDAILRRGIGPAAPMDPLGGFAKPMMSKRGPPWLREEDEQTQFLSGEIDVPETRFGQAIPPSQAEASLLDRLSERDTSLVPLRSVGDTEPIELLNYPDEEGAVSFAGGFEPESAGEPEEDRALERAFGRQAPEGFPEEWFNRDEPSLADTRLMGPGRGRVDALQGAWALTPEAGAARSRVSGEAFLEERASQLSLPSMEDAVEGLARDQFGTEMRRRQSAGVVGSLFAPLTDIATTPDRRREFGEMVDGVPSATELGVSAASGVMDWFDSLSARNERAPSVPRLPSAAEIGRQVVEGAPRIARAVQRAPSDVASWLAENPEEASRLLLFARGAPDADGVGQDIIRSVTYGPWENNERLQGDLIRERIRYNLGLSDDRQRIDELAGAANAESGWALLNVLGFVPAGGGARAVGAVDDIARGASDDVLRATQVAPDAPFAFEGAPQPAREIAAEARTVPEPARGVRIGEELDVRTGEIRPASPIDWDASETWLPAERDVIDSLAGVPTSPRLGDNQPRSIDARASSGMPQRRVGERFETPVNPERNEQQIIRRNDPLRSIAAPAAVVGGSALLLGGEAEAQEMDGLEPLPEGVNLRDEGEWLGSWFRTTLPDGSGGIARVIRGPDGTEYTIVGRQAEDLSIEVLGVRPVSADPPGPPSPRVGTYGPRREDIGPDMLGWDPNSVRNENIPEEEGEIPLWLRAVLGGTVGLVTRGGVRRLGAGRGVADVFGVGGALATDQFFLGGADDPLGSLAVAATPFAATRFGQVVAPRVGGEIGRMTDEAALLSDPAFLARRDAFAQTLDDAPPMVRRIEADQASAIDRRFLAPQDEMLEQGFSIDRPSASIAGQRTQFLEEATPREQLEWMNRVAPERAPDVGRIGFASGVDDAANGRPRPDEPIPDNLDDIAPQPSGFRASPDDIMANPDRGTLSQPARLRNMLATLAEQFGVEVPRGARGGVQAKALGAALARAAQTNPALRAELRRRGLWSVSALGVGVAASNRDRDPLAEIAQP